MPVTHRTHSPPVIRGDQLMDPSFIYQGDARGSMLPLFFQDGLPSPASSYISDRSLQPNYQLISPSGSKEPSPCTSEKSEWSVSRIFGRRIFSPHVLMRPGQTLSPCLSFKSDESMHEPIRFRNENFNTYKRMRPGQMPSPCLSFKSDESMHEPIRFSKENIPTCRSYAGSEDVACDICDGKRMRAVKWCLTCSVAYCETHVRQHYTVKALQMHMLTDVTGDLEIFCKSAQAKLTADLHHLTLGLIQRETEIMDLLKHNEELTAKVKNLERAESELSHLTNRFFRGLQDTTDCTLEFVEVAALGRRLDLGMLYDCRSDSWSSDIILWEKNLISSMKLSIPRPQTDMRILEADTLQDKLSALDLTFPLRASVVSGLVALTGASTFINHPVRSELQDRVTLCYRTSTRLDMLSQELLNDGYPLSVTGSTTATHVVVAVLYGSQAFFVFDKKEDRSAENTNLKDVVKKMIASSSQTDLLSRLTKKQQTVSLLYTCASFMDGDVLQSPINSRNPGEVPLKVWLYPLKNLGQKSACFLRDISEDQLRKSEKFLEKLNTDLSFCQSLMSVGGGHDIFAMFSALKEALSEFSSLLQKYRSNFQQALASCIKAIRETGAEAEEENLGDLLDRSNQSPFGSKCTHQWLQNKSAQVRALIRCRSANISILNAHDLQRFIQDCQADSVLCFVFTSLDDKDSFLSALRQSAESENTVMAMETPHTFRILDTSQKIFSDLQSFILNIEKNKGVQETMFIAASVHDLEFPGSAVRLYQSGNLVSQNVRLDIKPEDPEIITVQQTRVKMKLQNFSYKKPQTAEHYRVEYRAEKKDTIWTVLSFTGEYCLILGLAPATRYEFRYAIMDSNGMSDYSRITQFETSSRARPGAPTVLKPSKEALYIAWHRAETDKTEDSPVLYYIVEYMEAGLKDWQFIQTDGPVCECTITVPYSTCYKARVSAVYGKGDVSDPSEETKVPVRVWSIDLSNRKASLFLEVLRLQKTKKSVKLRDCTDEESEVRSFLQCLSYISQLRIEPPQSLRPPLHEWRNKMTSFLINLCLQAAIHQKETMLETVQKMPLYHFKTYREQSAFLLDLYSHVKDYQTQTGENVLAALQDVYQTLPEVWSVNLSERKASDFLEVLKLQTVKKAVELTGWSEDEGEMRSLLQCLHYISQLSFLPLQPQRECPQERKKRVRRFLLDLCLQAALHQKAMIRTITEKCFKTDKETSDFLLLLYSHVKDYETRTARSVLPALKDVYKSLPKIWSINLSDKKTSIFLEVLKLQTAKRAVELRGWSEEESEMRNLLQCLPYISQLRFGFVLHEKRRKITTLQFLVKLMAGAAERGAEAGESYTEIFASLCSFRPFSVSGDNQEFDAVAHCNILLELYLLAKDYEAKTSRRVLPVLQSVYETLPEVWTINLSDRKAPLFLEVLKLQTAKKVVELTGWSNEKRNVRSFVQCLPHISQLRLCSDVLVRMKQAKSLRSSAPVNLDRLLLIESSAQQPEGMPHKILTSLDFLMRNWKIQCLNLTESKMEAQSLLGLLNHQGPLTIRFSEETLQKLVAIVYEAQDEDLTRSFLRNLGGDLTSCTLSWDMIHWFLQHHPVTVDFRRCSIKEKDIPDLLPVLSKVHLRGLKSSFVLSIMRKLYETGSAHSVSSLLRLAENCINLENRKLNSIDCAALRFTLEHSAGVSLNLLWTSVPEGELESIVTILKHVSHLRVDRLLMLRLLHCCSARELQQEAAVLLSALHHKLDFFCHDALDLTTDTTTNTLFLSSADCRVISAAIQKARIHIELTLHDCEVEEAGVEQLFPVLHTVTLHCNKALLLRFLTLVRVGTEEDHVRRAVALSQAMRDEVILSGTQLNTHACKSLALVLEYSEGLSELDLSHCQLRDHELEVLMPHLHKTCILDLSHNHITDISARNIYDIVSKNSNIQTVCLFNNRITDFSLFLMDQRIEIW